MQLRKNNIEKLSKGDYDVLIIGGGINGAVSAAALACKGARVALIDKGDFAGFTSQESSNLAWGGIKYLETMEFGLVRKLCMSRNRLIRNYPSTVKEIRFLITHPKGFRRSLWTLLSGAWLYWFIGNGFTRPPDWFSRKKIEEEEGIVDLTASDGGFEYSDAYFHDNDARFVFNFVRSAMNYGCVAANYVESSGGERDQNGIWSTRIRDVIGGKESVIRSKLIINACGPYVDHYNQMIRQSTEHHHVFSKGIHLIVKKLSPNRRVLTFFSLDGRMFFVIPMGNRTCIGTTDTRVDHMESTVTEEDREFVLKNINHMLKLPSPLTTEDIVAERCGVRPLVVKGSGAGKQDWLALSRKHAVEANVDSGIISILGGKLTDCINIGEEISESVESQFGINLPYKDHIWYGEDPQGARKEFMHQAELMELDKMTSSQSFEKLSSRLWRRHGSHALELLESIREDPKMAEVLIKGTEYIHCEIELSARREMITKLDDFLRRRSKIALIETKETIRNSPGIMEACQILFGEEAQQKFDEYFNS
ncbi:MAG: glycerol-3-phosphate dehydrogenase/oxidase [SAR324 cluster bacterium]|nr:glycerol-3-phosphate dehydrogenase/oxidase [SAR324 cluster bacterium]